MRRRTREEAVEMLVRLSFQMDGCIRPCCGEKLPAWQKIVDALTDAPLGQPSPYSSP